MDFNLRCVNESWATVRAEAALDRHGNDVAVIVAKVAYLALPVGSSTRVRLSFRPVRWSDIPDGSGGVLYPGDLVDDKPGTDVGLVGTAHPPRGKAVERQLAWLTMGPLRKVVQVSGKRAFIPDWKGVVPGAAAALMPTALNHAACFGGRDRANKAGSIEEELAENPVGRGFALDPQSLVGKQAHCLEPVVDPVSGVAQAPSEGCFAPVPANWEPRRSRAGTHDEAWAKNRAPVRPRNFDVRHNNWAVGGLHSEKALLPDDPIEVGGVIAEGLWKFRLPKYAVSFEARFTGEEPRPIKTHLDSVLFDADERIVELSWRASVLLPRKWELFERMLVKSDGAMPAEVLEEDLAKKTA